MNGRRGKSAPRARASAVTHSWNKVKIMARVLTSFLFCLVMGMASARPLGPQSDPDPFQVIQVHMEEGCGMLFCDAVFAHVMLAICAGTSDALEDRGHDWDILPTTLRGI